MSDTLDDILGILGVFAGAAENISKGQLARTMQQDAYKQQEFLQDKKIISNRNNENYKFRRDQLNEVYKANDARLENLVKEFKNYNVNINEYGGLPMHHKTDAGQKILTGLGVEVGEDLNVSYDIAQNSRETLGNIDNAIGVQSDLINELSEKINMIDKYVISDLQNVQDVAFPKGIKDIEDVNARLDKLDKIDVAKTLDANGDILDEVFFGGGDTNIQDVVQLINQPENVLSRKIEENPWLADAYKSREVIDELQERGITADDADLYYKMTGKRILEESVDKTLNIDSVDANFKLRTGYDEIDRLEIALKKDNTDLAYGVGGLKGDNKQFLTPDVAKSNQGIIEDQIIHLLGTGVQDVKGGGFGNLMSWGDTNTDLLAAMKAGRGDEIDKKISVEKIYKWLMPTKGDSKSASGLRANKKTFNIQGKDVEMGGFHDLGIDFGGMWSGSRPNEYILKEDYLKALLTQWQSFNERYPHFLEELEKSKEALE